MRADSNDFGFAGDSEDVALANQLLDSGVSQSRVKEIFKGRLDDNVVDENVKEVKESREYEDKVLNSIQDDLAHLAKEVKPSEDFLDPLHLHLMKGTLTGMFV